jgi:hypothetical protein
MRRGMWLAAAALVAAAVLVPAAAQADPSFYTGPLFGISNAPGGALYVADAGRGVVDADTGALVAPLGGINDVAPIGRGEALAVATTDAQSGVFHASRGRVSFVADTQAFETAVDPAGDGTDEGSNPFDLARLGGSRDAGRRRRGERPARRRRRGEDRLGRVVPGAGGDPARPDLGRGRA